MNLQFKSLSYPHLIANHNLPLKICCKNIVYIAFLLRESKIKSFNNVMNKKISLMPTHPISKPITERERERERERELLFEVGDGESEP